MADPAPSPRQSTKEIFFSALDQATAEARAAYLDEACGTDLALRRRVEVLLSRHFEADPFMNQPAVEASAVVDTAEWFAEGPGTQIDRYKLLEKIGEGGFGVVYVAEQQQPVKRRVALKIIKLGMDTRQVVARFEAERQALALMDHANIAKVLDGGATETGRPYFVMELVRGIPITRYCEEEQLDTRARLHLFIKVCHAIQHAHQKGIIHRDIKPSNILVTLHDGVPVPKVIDFGIAKAMQQNLTEKTLYTRLHQFIGTPAYMSPEQAVMSGSDIDTRSDVYGLGVLLYELLTGQTPFDTKTLAASNLDEMRRTICDVQPIRPSTRLRRTRSASALAASPATRHLPLATDLDWIVMKCLEKDRTRRYETASGLAMDLQRHLENEPIVARPPSRLYEFSKTVQRHKIGFAAATTIILVLLAGVFVSSWQANRANRAESKAKEEELAARRRAYASDMMVATHALASDNLSKVRGLLDRQRPAPGQVDLRDWEWRYLWQQTRSAASFTLDKSFGKINSLTISSDMNWLVVGPAHQGGLSLWDLRTRQEAIRLVRNEERICADFSPTEPLLAFTSVLLLPSGQQRSTLRLWGVAARKIIWEHPLDTACVGLTFSKDGQSIATSTSHGHITLWRVRDGTELAPPHPTEQSAFEYVQGFAATPDLSFAAYTYDPRQEDGQWVRVIDLRNGRELWHDKVAEFEATALAVSPDGRLLASAAGIGEEAHVITLWDVASGTKLGQLTDHLNHILSLRFWPDGTKLASASLDQTIRVWDMASRKCVQVLRGQAEPVRALALSRDGKTLVSGGGQKGRVCVWDTSATHSRSPYATIPVKVLTWTFTPDSRSVLTLEAGGQVRRWAGPDFQEKHDLLEVEENLYPLWIAHRFSQDGRFLAVGSTNGVLQVWDIAQRSQQHRWTNTTGPVVALDFQSNGRELLTYSQRDNRFHTWDLATAQEIQSIPAPPWPLRGAMASGAQFLIVTDRSENVTRISTSDRTERKLSSDVPESSGIAFSPDGSLLAISSVTSVTRVWETATWSLLATNLYGLHSVAFSPDGNRLATGGGGRLAVSLWDVASWKNVATLQGEADGFELTAYSPDGNIIGSRNMAGTLHLWRAPSWHEIERVESSEGQR